jgi:hypothetical protein
VASGQPLDRLRPDRLSSIDLTMQGHGEESRDALVTKGKGAPGIAIRPAPHLRRSSAKRKARNLLDTGAEAMATAKAFTFQEHMAGFVPAFPPRSRR